MGSVVWEKQAFVLGAALCTDTGKAKTSSPLPGTDLVNHVNELGGSDSQPQVSLELMVAVAGGLAAAL